MTDYDPYEDAENRGLALSRRPLPPGIRGATDVSGAVWLETRLLRREERSALAHEIAHHDVEAAAEGRIGGGGLYHSASVEKDCDRIAAERLIGFQELVNAAKFCDSVEEMAEELNVDDRLVRARIGNLSGAEARSFEFQAGRIHYSMRRRSGLKRTRSPKMRPVSML